MAYLALARKWRPRTFDDVVGQPHIVRALTNALNSGRVHHAFLFAGTRGVGKTTIARILARCLNCETGVTATPCGRCAACTGIDEGRFVDLIEVDAASRTGVEDTRDLLDNVQYTPGSGRYKVYLVDEVHMLSKHAFNALLKTLEEPPPHVKFIFATTDPQKLPVTVLSRCLQFNLKRLPTALITARMTRICETEGVRVESGALARLARAAAGSMRDGLSLLDQALAYGNDRLREVEVAEMLGSLDRGSVVGLLQKLADGDAAALLKSIRDLDAMVPDYAALMDEIATALQRIAVAQLAGSSTFDEEDDGDVLGALAARFDPETVQLDYQIAITGRRDLALAPDPRIGFEMAMLRMLAFRPAEIAGPGEPSSKAPTARPRSSSPPTSAVMTLRNADEWAEFARDLPLDGAARQLAMHTALVSASPQELRLRLAAEDAYLLTEQLKARLVAAIRERRGSDVIVRIDLMGGTVDTPAARDVQRQDEALQRAQHSLESDPNVRDLADVFGAELVPGSVRALKPPEALEADVSRKVTNKPKERTS